MRKFVLITIITALLSGCDIILDEVVDCLDDDGPVFNTNQLPPAVLNQFYFYTIVAAIDNEPNDDRYHYDFSVTGRFPAGIRSYTEKNSRTITFSGTPTEAGFFIITLSVEVSDPYNAAYQTTNIYDDGDDLCRTSHSQSYNLAVAAM